MGWVCHTHAREEERTQGSGCKTRRNEATRKTRRIWGIISQCIFDEWNGVHLAHDTDKWQTAVKIGNPL